MINKKCTECENETMLKYSALACDYEDLKTRLKLTQGVLSEMGNLCNYLAGKCEETERVLQLFKEKAQKESEV